MITLLGLPRAKAALGLAFALALGAACSENPTTAAKPAPKPHAALQPLSREPLEPLPEVPALDQRVVALGRRLFHEPRLSGDAKVACASCHDLGQGGVNARSFSLGVHGSQGLVNAPTVYNASLNFVQFWDGRAATLEDQVGGPITNALEMGSSWEKVLALLGADPSYVADFAALPGGVNEANVRRAIADFERTLLTRGSPFDRFLAGDEGALSAEARVGYEMFKSVGCIACHQGRNVGGNMFQRFGVLGDYFKDRGHVGLADYGRYNVTHNESDRFVFKVPSLRNVVLTAPYFHDGSAATLPQAVQVMARYQLGRKLNDEQVREIIAFLSALAGEQAPAGAKI
jgi:cytochrome c peroxidase